MATKLTNVRLDPDRVRKARALKERGIAISDLLREAIDRRYREVVEADERRDARRILADLDARFPAAPDDLPLRSYSVHSREEAGAAIREHLRARSHRRR
jgi:hypothetical protein